MSVWILLKMMLNYSSNQFLHLYCFNVFRYVIWAQTLTADENTKIELRFFLALVSPQCQTPLKGPRVRQNDIRFV